MKADLTKLKQDADDAIGEIEAMDARPNEAINWADLSCVEAASVITDDGREYLQVTIAEASPDATELQIAMRRILIDKGWSHSVEIRTEW